MLQVHFALWHSTSASGPNRRVPPPRGLPPRCPSRAFPSFSVSSSPLSLTRRFLIPRCAACGPSSRVVHSPFFLGYVFLAVLYARQVYLPGQDGRVSRLRSTFTFCLRIQYSLNLVFVFRGDSAYRGGRTCFPTAFEYEHIFSFLYFFHFTVLVYEVHMQFLSVSPFLSFEWRGQTFDLCRPSGFCCTAELYWTSWLVAFLRPMHRTPADSRTGCPCCLGFR